MWHKHYRDNSYTRYETVLNNYLECFPNLRFHDSLNCDETEQVNSNEQIHQWYVYQHENALEQAGGFS